MIDTIFYIWFIKLNLHFYWNENLILHSWKFWKIIGIHPVGLCCCLIQHFLHTNIIRKNIFNMKNCFWKTPQMILIRILFISSITMPITKVDQIPNIRIRHSHPTIGPIVTQKWKKIYFWLGTLWQQYFWLIIIKSNLFCKEF